MKVRNKVEISDNAKERGFVMLKQFTFRNCYSFRDETTFSMEAVYGMKDNWDFVIKKGKGNACDYVLPVAAIYGANAGGKSNVIKALTDAARNISKREPWLQNLPFVADETISEAFEHKLDLLIGEYEYEYYYSVNDFNVVLKEYLKKRPIGHEAFDDVFDRKGIKIVRHGPSLSGADLNVIEASAKNKDKLVVNLAGAIGVEDCVKIFKWCESILSITQLKGERERGKHLDEFASSLANNGDELKRLTNFIRKFDTSIQKIELQEMRESQPFREESTLKEKRYSLRVVHTSYQSVSLPVYWESNGTQKILELYATLMDALDNGRPLVYDELDTMLHPLVFKKIVALFNDKKTNPNHAQLIFAAHNTVVLNREDLRRDEIHIAQKDKEGISTINRLSDFVDENGKKVRMDASYDRLYLEGMLGSIPIDFQDVEGGRASGD